MQSSENKIIIRENVNADLRVLIDGKKTNINKAFLTNGKHIVTIKNVIYLTKWYAFLCILLDFVLTIFGGVKFGELFKEQGYMEYVYEIEGNVIGDLIIVVDKDGISIEGIEHLIVHRDKRIEHKRVRQVLKHYHEVCAGIIAVVAMLFVGIILIMIYAV